MGGSIRATSMTIRQRLETSFDAPMIRNIAFDLFSFLTLVSWFSLTQQFVLTPNDVTMPSRNQRHLRGEFERGINQDRINS